MRNIRNVFKNKLIFNIANKLGFITLGKIIGFLTIPIISRALGPENYGVYNYAITIAGYAFLPANWGFLAKGIRDVAADKKNSSPIVNYILSSRINLWIYGSIICILISYSFFG